MTASEIRNRLLASGLVADTEMRGCTVPEIENLERLVGNRLPFAYQQFLLAIGHQAGRFPRGTAVSYDQVSRLTGAANDLLAENGFQEGLPSNTFVFYMHQGYEFGYFPMSEGEDPPVYQFVEGDGPPKVTWPSFTEYFIDMIRVHLEILKMIRHDQ